MYNIIIICSTSFGRQLLGYIIILYYWSYIIIYNVIIFCTYNILYNYNIFVRILFAGMDVIGKKFLISRNIGNIQVLRNVRIIDNIIRMSKSVVFLRVKRHVHIIFYTLLHIIL